MESLKEVDRRISESLIGAVETIGRLETTTYTNTTGYAWKLAGAIESIATTITREFVHEERYAILILYRVLIEHFLKLIYLAVRSTNERSDKVGLEYSLFSGYEESINWAESLNLKYSLLGMELPKTYREKAREIFGIAHHPKKDIDIFINHFKYKNIIRYLKTHPAKIIETDSTFFADLVEAYAKLSSYVHGGVSALDSGGRIVEASHLYRVDRNALYINMWTKSTVLVLLALQIPEYRASSDEVFRIVLSEFEKEQ